MSHLNSKHYSLQLITPPSVEPVSLADAKSFLRVDSNDDDALVTSLISAARSYCENYTNRKFITQTWELGMDCFPNARFGYDVDRADWYATIPVFSVRYMPVNPILAVNSVKYYDLSGTLQTLSTSIWQIDTRSEMGRLVPKYNQFWPITLPVPNAVVVNFDAGYGPDATFIPESIKTAIKMQVLNYYDNRNPRPDTQTYNLDTVNALLSAYQLVDM